MVNAPFKWQWKLKKEGSGLEISKLPEGITGETP